MLQAMEIQEPYFRDRKNEALYNIQEALASKDARPFVERMKTLLAGFAGAVTKYLILKPSIMGFGVDLGKVVEDAAKRHLKDHEARRKNGD